MNKKANVGIFIMVIVATLILIVIFGLAFPIGSRFQTEILKGTENIKLNAQSDIDNISDTTIKESINNINTIGMNEGARNIKLNNHFYEYSWIYILVIVIIAAIFVARQLVEVQTGGVA